MKKTEIIEFCALNNVLFMYINTLYKIYVKWIECYEKKCFFHGRFLLSQICISPEPGAKVNWQWGQVGWMLTDHRDGLWSSSF